ncbi:hypothetical protein ABT247_21155 [Kitasatospora sp. NPDC001539]|uniref:hypothetical protein n=1 Tax=Kitasatospora sp. NPDC001539 TaxID=3154384 RepID=UPI0033253E2A
MGVKLVAFARHARAARAALDAAFTVLALPAPEAGAAMAGGEGDGARGAARVRPGAGGHRHVDGQQTVPDDLLTAFRSACGIVPDEPNANTTAADGDRRDRTSATEQAPAPLPPDTTDHDEPLPTRSHSRSRSGSRPPALNTTRESAPNEAGRHTTDATTATAKPAPHSGAGTAAAQQSGQDRGLAAAEAELVAAARALVGRASPGLSPAADHVLQRLVTAVDHGDTVVLPHARRDTAALVHRRIRLPHTPEGQRLHTALATYATTWNNTGSAATAWPNP